MGTIRGDRGRFATPKTSKENGTTVLLYQRVYYIFLRVCDVVCAGLQCRLDRAKVPNNKELSELSA